jgi:hypothetical protein
MTKKLALVLTILGGLVAGTIPAPRVSRSRLTCLP